MVWMWKRGPGSEADIQRGYHPAPLARVDPHLQKMTELADPGVCIYEDQTRGSDKAEAEKPRCTRLTLEAYS